ncbi:hypothetical protein EG68_04104 [Paragonimus skrjabini miyazakii]|uniref:Uncharacterized protein n=1 Tax=Paragonimus skrjabini miyazakii TaxID=59628 RepID=A0A8S9Z018_9TREM|nr:hypothetical protein EG68_04104 [Paragonimus skrjabini miyazakii]
MKYLMWNLSIHCQINMIFYLWTVKAIQNSLLLHDQSPDEQVELTLTFTEKNQLLLRCYVKDVDVNSSLVLLSCPVVSTGVCLENCITPCPIIRGRPNCSLNAYSPINSCKYELISDRHVKLEYQIVLNPKTVPGDWGCMFRGKRSNSVYLEYQLPHNTPEPLDNSQKTITSLAVQGVISNSAVKTNRTKRFDLLTKVPMDLLYLILAFTGVSLMFNIWFFVRCLMIKNYLRKLQRGEPRSFCFDQFCCVDKPRFPTVERHPLKYTHVPELQSHFPAYGTNSTWTHHGPTQTVLRPSSPIFVQSQLRPSTRPFFSVPRSTPMTFHRPALHPNSTKDNSETVYDEVHNSVYTTVNPLGRNLRMKHFMPGLTTPDGQKWMLAPSGQFYLPHNEISGDKVNRRNDHCLPEPPSDLTASLIDLENPNNPLQPRSIYQSVDRRAHNPTSIDGLNRQLFAAPVQENKIQVQRNSITNTSEVGVSTSIVNYMLP